MLIQALIDFIALETAPALIFYLITWFARNKKDGKAIKVKGGWHILGFFIVAYLLGMLRLLSMYIVGGKTALDPESGSFYAMLFTFILPIVISIAVVEFIKSKATRVD